MDLLNVVDNLTPEMYERFKSAVETGRWPEGTVVDPEQRASAMHIVMAYQSRVLQSQENMTVGADGQIVAKSKRELKSQFVAEQVDYQEQKCVKPASGDDIARFSDL